LRPVGEGVLVDRDQGRDAAAFLASSVVSLTADGRGTR